jgi:hypothetical protein
VEGERESEEMKLRGGEKGGWGGEIVHIGLIVFKKGFK